ncbi:right-handed parallel beta-helix repeat-containing protein [Parabacteroides pacaensis]|uniref:right-handed parallel beta-helix repeat-containing protein n=1 Tax=Parabacteroides pacaensis TaxID=2086575 RepID=UPI000D105618|nr:right-handed parallel beta-helix repeat-containing protein [Parabacteroides pacaensis]
MKIHLLWLLLLPMTILRISAQEVIQVTQFGAVPNSHANAMSAIKQALAYCKDKSDIILNFPTGRYDFWPTPDENKTDNIGFDLYKMNRLTIEGNGSEFIFHGWMGIAQVKSCSDIRFKNFSVDWDRPLISQAEIVHSTDSYLDVKIDRKSYPYIIENKKIFFLGEDWKLPVLTVYNNLYDKKKKEIVYNTWDDPLGNIFEQQAEELEGGIVRFYGKPPIKPERGTYVSLFHARYAIVGFHLQKSKDILLENLQIYHCLSHGVLGDRTENITMNNASMKVNDTKGRVFSIIADASHFVNCKGVIKVENCAHTGQGDDFMNVHGRNVIITDISDNKTIEVKTDGSYMAPTDQVWFIKQEDAQRGEIRTVKTVVPITTQNKITGYKISFTKPLPKGIKKNDFIENKTWTAGLELRNCQILKRHRARGILVTTPKKVIIENNYFRTAGTAILIEGDTDYWYESGANNNVQIRNNVFEDCLTSGNAHGSKGEWGEAVITITPSHRPQDTKAKPYHTNICIRNNVFKVFDAPLIHARSVRNLSFIENEVVKTYSYKPYTWQKSAFQLDGCRHVVIKKNRLDKDYTTRDIRIEHMKKSDVRVAKGQQFKIDF